MLPDEDFEIGKLYRYLPSREELDRAWDTSLYTGKLFYKFLYTEVSHDENLIDVTVEHFYPKFPLLFLAKEKPLKGTCEYKFLHGNKIIYSDVMLKEDIPKFKTIFLKLG